MNKLLIVLVLFVSLAVSQTQVCKTPTGTECVSAAAWPRADDRNFKRIPLLVASYSNKPVYQMNAGLEYMMSELPATRKLVMAGSIQLSGGCAVSCEWFAQNSVPTCSQCSYPFVIYQRLPSQRRCIDFDEDFSLKNLPSSQLQALISICSSAAKCKCNNQSAPKLSSVEMKKFLARLDPFAYAKQPIRSGGDAQSPASNYSFKGRRIAYLKTVLFRKGETCTEGINIPFMEYDDELETLKANGLSHLAEKSLLAKETYTINIALETIRVPEQSLYSHISNNRQIFGVASGSSGPVEQQMAYFREDLWYTLGHHQWHNTYKGTFAPISWHAIHFMPRLGESFLYFHRQLLNRNNAERFAIGIPLVAPMAFNGEQIVGYHSKYDLLLYL